MTPEQFVYWFQGFVEISGEVPTEKQWEIIKDHIELVFNKKTPDRSKTDDESTLQNILDKLPRDNTNNPYVYKEFPWVNDYPTIYC